MRPNPLWQAPLVNNANIIPVLEQPQPATLIQLGGKVIEGMTNPVYHAQKCLSHSLMRWLEPNMAPLQFWHRSWLNPDKAEDPLTVGINTGSLLHDAMEDFEAFKRKVESGLITLLPNVMRTKRPKHIGAARGGQLDAILNLRSKLLAMALVQEALVDGKPETSIFAEYPLEPWLQDIYGQESITIRCRPDLDSPKVVLHWKFVSSIDPYRLALMIERFRYMEGVAHYRHCDRLLGIPDRRHILVFCETYAPYEIRTIEPSHARLDECQPYGERAITRFCQLHAKFGDTRWPDFGNTPQNVYTADEGGADRITLPYSYDKRLMAAA